MSIDAHAPVHTVPGTASPRWMALVFAGGLLAIGMLIAFASFAAQPDAIGTHAPQHYPPVYPPDWLFWAIWIVIYPCWGVATWLVWTRRHNMDTRPFWRFFAVMFVEMMAFLPISALTHGNRVVLTTMDALGFFILTPLTVWMYRRYAPAAVWWLVPMLLWGPITTGFKLWLVLVNRS